MLPHISTGSRWALALSTLRRCGQALPICFDLHCQCLKAGWQLDLTAAVAAAGHVPGDVHS